MHPRDAARNTLVMPQNAPLRSASSSTTRVVPERVDDLDVDDRLMARSYDRYGRAVQLRCAVTIDDCADQRL